MSLYVWGDTRLCKILCAQRIFNVANVYLAYIPGIKHSYIHKEWNVQQLDTNCDYMVIDDILLNQLKQYKTTFRMPAEIHHYGQVHQKAQYLKLKETLHLFKQLRPTNVSGY